MYCVYNNTYILISYYQANMQKHRITEKKLIL